MQKLWVNSAMVAFTIISFHFILLLHDSDYISFLLTARAMVRINPNKKN